MSKRRLALAGLAFLGALVVGSSPAWADPCDRYRATLTREANAVFGIGAPVPAFAAQLFKESTCRADVTAWDNGRGIAQFMDGTTAQVSRMFPELGVPDPYNPTWSIRAMVRYDDWLLDRVKGDNECERWGAGLKSYNAGPGYVQRAQRKSTTPGQWFGATEYINAGQSAVNFDYSRRYPRIILFTHQLRYQSWGPLVCIKAPQ